MKVFTSKQFIEKLKWLVNSVPNYYHSEAGTWCNYNKSNGKFMMDCVVSIKGLLWGFEADKNKAHGGAIYGSNGVADFTPDGGLNYCNDVSSNFSNLTAGEYLCMKGTGYSHAGIYLGNGKVFECTTGWGANKCIISDISSDGTRSYNGSRSLKWTYHGKLQWIDYTTKLKYRSHIQEQGWQDWKTDGQISGTVGKGKRLEAIQIDAPFEIKAKAHIQQKGWVDYGVINKNTVIGTTGQGKRLEALCLKGNFKYRVHIQNSGWSTWTNADGIITLGSVGQGLRIEAIEII